MRGFTGAGGPQTVGHESYRWLGTCWVTVGTVALAVRREPRQSAEQKRGDGLTQDLDGPHLSVHLCLLELKGLWRLQHLPAPLLPAGLWPLGSSVSPQNPTSPSIQAFTRAAPHAQDGPLLSLERSGLFTGLPLGLRIPPAARRPPCVTWPGGSGRAGASPLCCSADLPWHPAQGPACGRGSVTGR